MSSQCPAWRQLSPGEDEDNWVTNGQRWTTITSAQLKQDKKKAKPEPSVGRDLIKASQMRKFIEKTKTDLTPPLKETCPITEYSKWWSKILLVGIVMFTSSNWHYLMRQELKLKLISYKILSLFFFLFEDKEIFSGVELSSVLSNPTCLCPDFSTGEWK